jgi:transketolase
MPERPDLKTLANAVRFLSADAVQQANSGHPGAPMGLAEVALVLWCDVLKHNPNNPNWFDRDRVVLSNGHASMLLYAVLHLTGYDLPMEEIKNFRQLHSRTPGHPECGHTPGVETTTGPLGQGLANAVGMALAERLLAERFNRTEFTMADHRTFVLLGDGCMMEGVSQEAASLAGTLGLGKLVAIYDDNDISIDGNVKGWFRDDIPARFEACGWRVIRDVDGHDPMAVRQALERAKQRTDKPCLICCKTVIGYGAPNKAGSAAAHGAPLGVDEVLAAREHLGWEHPPFFVPEEIYAAWDCRDAGAAAEGAWNDLLERYKLAHPEMAAEFLRRVAGELPLDWGAACAQSLEALAAQKAPLATRKASLAALDAFGPLLPELVGGSADLSGSNGTLWKGARAVTPEDFSGNYLHFGVREMGMTAISSGMALHGGIIPFQATFLVFSDYARNAIRMSAIMNLRSVHIFTHDSIGVGEDGPTHQPVEHAASLRLIPNLEVWRPADQLETAVAWKCALERTEGPTALLLTRQSLPQVPRDTSVERSVDLIDRGGYVCGDCDGRPELLLLATGSEVPLVLEAARVLTQAGRRVRVVSLPCVERFLLQGQQYRNEVLPPEVSIRLVVEAGVTACWHRLAGDKGRVLGLDGFGLSAPGKVLFEHFGFTVENVVKTVQAML